ncbi:type I secretion system ATPase [Nitratireductor aestuarii]|uniref:Type I secretion system ATPase n=1 Tax=Nitratireductor aestuarii TaxID=1735103 RepID=A0A916RRR1_9HYPH|nr:hypothetical protein [Nitratireductor aestuarii]GGA63694.1 type I secretion system ATPase [Nitratireductor aestuarii]
MLLDKTSEAIAHFIGLFGTIVEDARERTAYDEFIASQTRPDTETLPEVSAEFHHDHQLVDFVPGVKWQPSSINIVKGDVPFLPYQNIKVDLGPQNLQVSHTMMMKAAVMSSGAGVILPEIPTVGSVANYVNQMIGLSDDDNFNVGGSGLEFSPDAIGDAPVLQLAAEASEFLFQAGPDIPGNAEALKDFSDALIDYIEAQDPETAPEGVFVAKGISIEGIFVNGELVEEAPNLDDYFSFKDRLDAVPSIDDELPNNAVVTDDGIAVVDQSVTVEMAQNTLVNSAVVNSLWTGGVVMAVLGDHTELNVISQVNAYADQDSVSGLLDSWATSGKSTETFNIAHFDRTDPGEGTSGTATGSFPSNWVVTEVEGDLLIVNWLQQITFMTDNDIGIASSSGVTSMIYSGQNTGVNTIDIYELGFAYDLIVIGGSVYDINVIQQMNVLYDNDMIGAVDGFHTSGSGQYDTSGNLLWNEAYIHNIGGQYEAMSDDYREAVTGMTNGDHSVNALASDPAFAGSGPLRVLYIDGDMINVQYIRQTNMLGDADQLALAMHKSGMFENSDWTISTGNNALVNLAAINDLDSLGTTYVGGNQYSQELLVQADIISTSPEGVGWQNADALVNEAVAFLSDALEDSTARDTVIGTPNDIIPYDQHGDGVQSMLG